MKPSRTAHKKSITPKASGNAKASATPLAPAAPPRPSPLLLALERLPERFDFWLVFACAWLVRLLYVALASHFSPTFDVTLRGLDQFTYQSQADMILGGDLLLRKVGLFYYSPIYAYYSALVYKLIGHHSFLALHLVQSVTGAFTCALGFSLARTWLSRPAALLAGLFYTLMATWLFYEQELLHEGFMLLFYMVLLWGLRTAALGRRWPLARLVLAGVFGMLAMIGRGNAALVLLALIPWVLLATPPLKPVWRPRLNLAGALAFCLGLALVFGPLMLRNHAVSSRWSVGMGNGKVLFYIGNNAESDGEFVYTKRFNEAFGKAPQEPGVYGRYFIEDLKSAPGHVLKILLYKTYAFFATYDLPDNLNFQLGRWLIPPVRFTPVQWEWLMPLGLVGLGLSLFRRRGWGLLWLFTGVFALSLIIIIPIGRYRQPVVIPMVIFAAAAVEWAAGHWRRGDLIKTGPALAMLMFLIIALWPAWHEEQIRINDYQMDIMMALRRNRPDLGEKILRAGQADFPRALLLDNCAFGIAKAKNDRVEMRRLSEVLLQNPPLIPEDVLAIAKLDLGDGNLDRARALLTSLIEAKFEGGDEIKSKAREMLARLGQAGLNPAR